MRDPFFTWWVEGAVEAASAEDVDLVYASMSPFESGEAAARLARRLGKQWVADLRDPWALDEMLEYPTWLHRRLAVRRMRSVLSTASAIVMNTDEAVAIVRGFPELSEKPVVAVPNGFDPEDFAQPEPRRRDGAFRIVHTGYLHTDLARGGTLAGLAKRALGGRVPGVNVLARSHVYLLQAVDRICDSDPSLARTLEIHLAGALSTGDLELARSRVVTVHGYLPHAASVALLRSADLLFLPMHDLPAGRRARIVPGKTYEYLASRRPILAAVPDGDARDLLARSSTAFLCRPTDVECMTRVIADELERVRNGGPPPQPDERLMAGYERRNLTGRLAHVFDEVLRAGNRHGPRRERPLAPPRASSTPA
jgi:glycosyltransferase involved in cell wall biosynthesis